MSNVSQFSTTAASNNSAVPDGFPESMAPSGVNDAARELMAALAKWYAGTKGGLSTAGSSNAYTLTTGSSHAALGDIGLVVAKSNHGNTGAATLNVDTLGAKAIEMNGSALVGGEIVSGETYLFVYNSGTDAFEVFGAANVSSKASTPYTAAQYFTPTTVTSTSNAVAINMVSDQFCKHSLTENTTISAPSNLSAGMQFVITVTQHASSAKTLAWNAVFKGTIPTMTTATGSRMTFSFYSPDGTNLDFVGASDAIA